MKTEYQKWQDKEIDDLEMIRKFRDAILFYKKHWNDSRHEEIIRTKINEVI